MKYVIDLIIVALLVAFFIRGFHRGLIREVFSLVAFLAAVILAFRFASQGADFLRHLSTMPQGVAVVAAFLIIFCVVFGLVRFFANLLQRFVEAILLGWANRLGGGAVSLFKGAILVSLMIILVALIPISGRWVQAERDSRLFQPLRGFAPAVFNAAVKYLPGTARFVQDMKRRFPNVSWDRLSEHLHGQSKTQKTN